MCIFSTDVELVSNTHIFCRVANGNQYCVYEMKLTTPDETAMVLPVPIAPGSGEDALQFISLEEYDTFFDDLDAMFPEFTVAPAGLLSDDRVTLVSETLEVHRVGSFEASFVPTIADFDRLDPRFRLPQNVWDALPMVQDYGFAVFKLAPGKELHLHPMAFVFPTRDPSQIVFPTIHVHDGEVHDMAEFDHQLYCQLGDVDAEIELHPDLGSLGYWEQSRNPAESGMDLLRTDGIIDGNQRCYRQVLSMQTRRNEDITLSLSLVRDELDGAST